MNCIYLLIERSFLIEKSDLSKVADTGDQNRICWR